MLQDSNAYNGVNLTDSGDQDPCQNSDGNVFAEKDDGHWEYRYLQCETENTPCTAVASCCECKLVCMEGFDCSIQMSPTVKPTTAPKSKDIVESNNKNDPPNPGFAEEASKLSKTSLTSSSRLDFIGAIASLIVLLSCCINTIVILRKLRKRGLNHSRYGTRDPIPVDTADAYTEPGAGGKDDPVFVAKVKRHQDIICKFHFRTIPYKQVDGGSSRSSGSWGTNDSCENSFDFECPASPGSVQRRLHKQKQKKLRSTLSFWRRRVRKDECCICLENYGPGDTICVPISSSCNHMFHEECVVAWLQHNNRCPLCRVDLMKEVKNMDDLPTSLIGQSGESSETPAPIPSEIIQTEEQMEEPQSSESDEEAHSIESNEDHDVEAPQAAEESSLNGQQDEEENEAHNGESEGDRDVESPEPNRGV